MQTNISESMGPLPALPGTFLLPSLDVSRDDMIAFARAFDPQPFHIDEDAAQNTLLGGLSASAWYTCARISGLVDVVMRDLGLGSELAGVEQIMLTAPVRAGDRLSGCIRLTTVEPCACGEAACQGRIDVENQRGELVMRLILDLIVRQSAVSGPTVWDDCKLRRPRSVRVERTPRDDVIRHFEEIGIGDEAVLGPYSFNTRSVETFCALTHAEPEQLGCAAEAMPHAVPNWHLPAAWMECMLRYYEDEAARFAARGWAVPRLGPAAGVKHLRWVRPVHIGETIVFRGWAERKMEIASQKDWGLLVVGAEGINSRGNVVVSFCPQMLIERSRSAA